MKATDTCWHIKTVTENGTISLLRNLTADLARQTYRKLRPDEHPKKYVNAPDSGSFFLGGMSRIVRGGDIAHIHILGPEGTELDPWKGVAPRIVDVAAREKIFQR